MAKYGTINVTKVKIKDKSKISSNLLEKLQTVPKFTMLNVVVQVVAESDVTQYASFQDKVKDSAAEVIQYLADFKKKHKKVKLIYSSNPFSYEIALTAPAVLIGELSGLNSVNHIYQNIKVRLQQSF